jgi:hypothetical protein
MNGSGLDHCDVMREVGKNRRNEARGEGDHNLTREVQELSEPTEGS